MKATTVKLPLNRWPYGLEVQPSANGLLLRPRRKARMHWERAFRRPRQAKEDLASVRHLTNEFDVNEWQW